MINPFDPQLQILRSLANSLGDEKQKVWAERSRFKLFAALESKNWKEAKLSLDVLVVAFETSRPGLPVESLAAARSALDTIKAGIPFEQEARWKQP